jgi:AcrR family transcriptional regulator
MGLPRRLVKGGEAAAPTRAWGPEGGVVADGRPFHRGLDRDSVLSAALRVLDRDGRAALTMRRLAQELDVEAASLYTHVRNKDDLVDGVLDRILDEVELPASRTPWRSALVASFSNYRATLLAHPTAVSLMTERARTSPAQYRLVERSLEILEGGGLAMRTAVRVHVALFAFTLGFVMQEVGRSPGTSPGALESSPVVRRALAALATQPVDERFRAGLDLILDGAVSSNRQ